MLMDQMTMIGEAEFGGEYIKITDTRASGDIDGGTNVAAEGGPNVFTNIILRKIK